MLRDANSDFSYLPGKLRRRFVEHMPTFFPCYFEASTPLVLQSITPPEEPPIGFTLVSHNVFSASGIG